MTVRGGDRGAGPQTPPLLRVSGLGVGPDGCDDRDAILRRIDLSVAPGETLALVGESGCGKSMTALALMGLLPPAVRITAGHIWLGGIQLVGLPERVRRRLRGGRMAMVFQEPQSALNPVLRVGDQIGEALRLHGGRSRGGLAERSAALLAEVGIGDPRRRMQDYPQRLSGGMRQRVMIAMALAGRPELLIADEPTTALDVTVQAEILALLKALQGRHAMAMLLISHDLGVVAETADRVALLHGGRIVETASCRDFLAAPRHGNAQRLVANWPDLRRPSRALGSRIGAELLRVRDLTVHFPVAPGLRLRRGGVLRAVEGVSFSLHGGATLGLVGESGCGKTTAGRALLQLLPAAGGSVRYRGEELIGLAPARMRHLRKDLQLVFQDPYSSMSPRMRIGEIVGEGLQTLGLEPSSVARRRRVAALLERVGLSPADARRYPHELSGGQRQRVCIARALIVAPSVLVCDEPTSALDVGVQAQLLELLACLQRERDMAYLFISHDLAVIAQMATAVAVMYLGRIVEFGPVEAVLERPHHPYTRALLAAVPTLDAGVGRATPGLAGEQPSPIDPPSGCRFHPRCPVAVPICATAYPNEVTFGDHHRVACHRAAVGS